ncbi:M14 family metallopeptidase [Acidovorax sp. D2M1]|uniref:M14 family metallopeptidase n=1 Tax=Acidovorax benzenivorans TaxID=2987520 RepID=A0ABT5S3V7_9BURK|nr:M14 family metallopeptidase [Acidovorax benzenivorans]MDD2180645.1 M14 family metallopeptidase [Acidovorax benzenivorans]
MHQISSEASTSVRPFFSTSYTEARAKFIAASAKVSAVVEHHVLPIHFGAQGETLSTNVALVGPTNAKSLLILSSGVHGPEGLCGSGCQISLLHDDALLRLAEEREVALLLIHAVNPYGFSHIRRTNEDNVDLNRNFIDFSNPTRNSAYAKLHDLLIPAQWPPSEDNIRAMATYRATHGEIGFRDALTTGQSEVPGGLFYAGVSPSWSNWTLRRILRTHGARRERIAWIDIHTGLGRFGHGEKIHAGRTGALDNLRATRTVWGADVVAAWRGESASRQVLGQATAAMFEECPQAEHLAIALEYGTKQGSALDALRAESWLQRYPRAASAAQKNRIKKDLLDAFYVDHDEWRGMVVGQCRTAILQGCLALGY